MKIILLAILIAGCSNPVACIDGKLWANVDPFGSGNIYTPTNTECKETKWATNTQ